MHGVKRLFAWMIPRFDAALFDVSLVSLRKKDLSEETLDALGIDIAYLHKSKFDPSTLTALLKIIDRKDIDILHLHGYGATTFGRMAAALDNLAAPATLPHGTRFHQYEASMRRIEKGYAELENDSHSHR